MKRAQFYTDTVIRLDFTKQLVKPAGRTCIFHNTLKERGILKTAQDILRQLGQKLYILQIIRIETFLENSLSLKIPPGPILIRDFIRPCSFHAASFQIQGLCFSQTETALPQTFLVWVFVWNNFCCCLVQPMGMHPMLLNV